MEPNKKIQDGFEITPEMIAAGALELAGYDREFESLEEGAIRIFVAMKRARANPGEKGRLV